ncbi:uncharacterized protein LOC110176090 [Drosophila serrata]|uniref:uncharacterized protein LOC110176090 n=1 Tax=Drosophila serrata TaxID=7274 RepID=UPI000A1D365B|nr:uncharacterized protein LOC110176090 [Drosophila serrata]
MERYNKMRTGSQRISGEAPPVTYSSSSSTPILLLHSSYSTPSLLLVYSNATPTLLQHYCSLLQHYTNTTVLLLQHYCSLLHSTPVLTTPLHSTPQYPLDSNSLPSHFTTLEATITEDTQCYILRCLVYNIACFVFHLHKTDRQSRHGIEE